MPWVDFASPAGEAQLAKLWQRDRGEYSFVRGTGHSSLCRCVRQYRGRTIANRLVPCSCWWGSGGAVGQPIPPTVPLPEPRPLLRRAVAELRRIEFGVDFECPSCGRGEASGHTPACALRAILEDADLSGEAPDGSAS